MSLADDILSTFINFDVCHDDTSPEPVYEPAKAEGLVLHLNHDSNLLCNSWPQFFDILNPCPLSSECSEASWDFTLLPDSPVTRSPQSLLFSVDPATIYFPGCLDLPSPGPEESMSDLTSDSDSTDSSLHSSPFSPASFALDIEEEERCSSSPFFNSLVLRLEEGRYPMARNLSLSPLTSMASVTQDSPRSSLSIPPSPSSPSPPASPILDLQEKPTSQDSRPVEQGFLVNHTRAKLRKNRNVRRTLSLSPKSCKSLSPKERSQDASDPEPSSSEPVRSGNDKSQDNRYACNACGRTFTRRADIPRHVQSSCPVIGKAHLPACDLCGKTYSRIDAIRRHQRTGDCHVGNTGPTRRSGRRS